MRLKELFESKMSDQEIHQWMKDHAKLMPSQSDMTPDYEIINGKINVDGGILIRNFEGTELPLEFGKVTGAFSVFKLHNLSSWKGFPEEARHVCTSYTNITSLVGIEKQIKKLNALDIVQTLTNSGGLGILMIDGLKEFYFSTSVKKFGIEQPKRAKDAFTIIKKYLGRPNDIFECQAELIDAGLEEFAEL